MDLEKPNYLVKKQNVMPLGLRLNMPLKAKKPLQESLLKK